MPRMTITRSLLREVQPKDKPYEIHDDRLPGFLVRVSPSGRMVYVAQYARGKRINIGRADVMAPDDARTQARLLMADYAKGVDPMEARRQEELERAANTFTFKRFVDTEYAPWVRDHHKDAENTLRMVGYFTDSDLGSMTLDEIDAAAIERWRSARLKAGASKSSVNRYMNALSGALSRAVEWKRLETHPMKGVVKAMKLDTKGVVRYLTDDEEERLMAALEARDAKLRARRESFNEWRRAHHQKPLPVRRDYGDHLTPMVIVSLHTGLRLGEITQITWADLGDLDADIPMLTVPGAISKAGQTRFIPLNETAVDALKRWRGRSRSLGLVFPGPKGTPMTDVDTSWKKVRIDAKLERFRWHDIRHTFASRLVMAGCDLNTVRELMGHADIKQTLRYAHLAPQKKADAVAMLVKRKPEPNASV